MVESDANICVTTGAVRVVWMLSVLKMKFACCPWADNARVHSYHAQCCKKKSVNLTIWIWTLQEKGGQPYGILVL